MMKMEHTTAEKTTREELLEAGMKENELGNWCSDLHVLKNDISTEYMKNKYQFPMNVKTFRSAIDGTVWYDVPFAYSEYYAERRALVIRIQQRV
jgi:hypothetical protein